MTQLCTCFKARTDVAQNLIDKFFSGKILSEKKNGSTGLISEKTEALHVKLNERAEETTNNFSSI